VLLFLYDYGLSCFVLGIILRLRVVVVCLNVIEVVIVGVRRWGTYYIYINFVAGPNIRI